MNKFTVCQRHVPAMPCCLKNYEERIEHKELIVVRQSDHKYYKDELFFETEDYITLLDGVIFNKNELLSEKGESWEKAFIRLYENNGVNFFRCFRGTFRGVLIDKKKQKQIVFVDHIGSKPIYYFSDKKIGNVFSTDLWDIVRIRKESNINNELNINSAYMMLSYGYMVEENTLIDGVKKIWPGNYIELNEGALTPVCYHRFSNEESYVDDESTIIDKIDVLFTQAIRRQFDKDLEYGHKHFVGLSGGLDSRMTSWVANELGYANQLNFTFSQSDYLDETIPKKIAAYLKHEWIFKSLDNGLFMDSLNETTKISQGNVSYIGIAHGLSLYKYVNFTELGVIHTGQLGDVILGTYSGSRFHQVDFENSAGAYSKKLVSKLNLKNLNYPNEELFKLYLRGFSGMNGGLLGLQKYSETMSPFYDIDLMEYALSIPVSLRFNHYIYFEYINKKYPGAAEFVWESTGRKPKNNKFDLKYNGKQLSLRKVLGKLGIIKWGINSPNHMNPLDYWYVNNPRLKQFFDDFFEENIDKVSDYELKQDIINLFQSGNVTEKGMVASLLSFIKTVDATV